MNKTIENEKIIKRNYFIGKSSSNNRIGNEMMKVPKSFRFDVRRLGMSGGEIWSLRGHDFFPKSGINPI